MTKRAPVAPHTFFTIHSKRQGFITESLTEAKAKDDIDMMWKAFNRQNRNALSEGVQLAPFDYSITVRCGTKESLMNYEPGSRDRRDDDYGD